jgi:hypothetical protein
MLLDPELAIVTWLQAQLGPGVRCVTELPAELAAACPLVSVETFGGDDPEPVVDRAVLDVTAYAAGQDVARGQARSLALQVKELLRFHLPGSVVTGGSVSKVEPASGIQWQPYDNTTVRRFHASYRVVFTTHS